MKTKIFMSVLVIVVAVSLVVGGTMAWFTDSEVSTGNTFTAGTLKIDVNNNGSSGAFNILPISTNNLAPGDVTQTYYITVKNTGSLNAATFGRFTLPENAYGLAQQFEIYDYQVLYFDASGNAKARWATDDNYYGSLINEDRFIKDGVSALFTAAGVGGSADLYTWITTNGVCDSYGQYNGIGNWDVEGLKPNESYQVNFKLKFKETAGNTYQGKNFKLGFEVKAAQTTPSTDGTYIPAVAEIFSLQYAKDINWACRVN